MSTPTEGGTERAAETSPEDAVRYYVGGGPEQRGHLKAFNVHSGGVAEPTRYSGTDVELGAAIANSVLEQLHAQAQRRDAERRRRLEAIGRSLVTKNAELMRRLAN